MGGCHVPFLFYVVMILSLHHYQHMMTKFIYKYNLFLKKKSSESNSPDDFILYDLLSNKKTLYSNNVNQVADLWNIAV